jgi:hypothetical protein
VNPPEIQAAVQDVLSRHEPRLRSIYSGWPSKSCFDTCSSILRDLQGALPLIELCKGYFYDSREDAQGGRIGATRHCWLGLQDGTIIDPTAGQFLGGAPLRVFGPDADEQELYRRHEQPIDGQGAEAEWLVCWLASQAAPRVNAG